MYKLARQFVIIQSLFIALIFIAAPVQSAQPIDNTVHDKVKLAADATDAVTTAIQVEVVGAPEMDKESQAVLDALKKLMHGLEHRDLDVIGSCLSEHVTQINDQSKVLYGKTEVLEHIKQNIFGTTTHDPVKRMVVYSPFICVKGDTAMVSFRATKELGGGTPRTLESLCSEVFERKDGQWLVLQLRTNWKPLKK